MVSLNHLLIWMAMDISVTSAESTNKIVSCAACQVMSSHSAWECDVKCNTAPEGTLIYGESNFITKLDVLRFDSIISQNVAVSVVLF